MAGFCTAGGKMVEKIWVPLGTKDYAAAIAKIPRRSTRSSPCSAAPTR